MITLISSLTFLAIGLGYRLDLGIVTGGGDFCVLSLGLGGGATYLVGTSGSGKTLTTFDFLPGNIFIFLL